MTLAFAPERIEQWPLARLQPYAKNAKLHGADQVAKIAASMAEFGWTVPCLVGEDGELIAGHGRVKGCLNKTMKMIIPLRPIRGQFDDSQVTRLPIDPSSMTRWRNRIGEEGVEWLLTETIKAGQRAGTVQDDHLKKVTVDSEADQETTWGVVSPTNGDGEEHRASHRRPTVRRKLVGLARAADISLRQNYNRLGPRLCGQVGRFAHARQFKRMRKALRRLKGYTGRVLRDIERQMDKVGEGPLKSRLRELVALVNRLLAQKPKDRKKLYSLHEPAVDCISKGKAHKRYEFGTKVSVATTTEGGFVVGMRSLPGNPYDGHTLHEALEQVEILTDQRPDMAFVDRGYRGHGVETVKVFISGARRGITRTIAKLLRRRSAIEPMIGHMKTDGRLTRCTLKGTTGDALFAVLCGCGHNIRMILRHLRAILCQLVWLITLLRGFMQGAYRYHALQFAA